MLLSYKKNIAYQVRHIDFSMITQTNKAVAIFDTNLCFIEASKKWMKIHHLKEREILFKSIFDIFPKSTKVWESRYQKCLKGKFLNKKQIKHTHADGSEQWVRWGIRPWRNYEGEIAGILITSKDITQKKARKENARRNKKLLEEIGQVSRVGGWEYTVASKQLFWTSITREIHGVNDRYIPTLEKAIGFLKNIEDMEKTNLDIEEAIKKDESYNVELKIITAKGEERWINTNGKAEFKNGKCIRLYGTVQDIHNRKVKEIEVAQSEERYRKTFDNAITGIIIVDPSFYRFKEINQNACQLFGYSKDEILKLSLRDLNTKGDTSKSITLMKQLNTGEISSFIIEEKYFRKNGEIISVEFGASAIRDINNNVVNYICQIRDITETKKKENTIKNFVTVTRKQNKRLLNFAHIVSHNLRSHSGNFKMLLELFKIEKDKAEKNKILELLNKASGQLSETIDNLNQVVTINDNVNKIKETINLKSCVTKIKSNIEALIKEKKVTIINNIPEDISIPLVPAYMDSILLNLTTNSIKYQSLDRDPVIKFSTTRINNHIVLSVEDNGIGIDLKKHGHKLFGMYKTFHGNQDARGLGLFMTKNQVEAMNGKIETESTPNIGTTFKIYLNKSA